MKERGSALRTDCLDSVLANIGDTRPPISKHGSKHRRARCSASMSAVIILDRPFKLAGDAEKAVGPAERRFIRMARHRFQAGHVFKRGKRRKLWVGRWREAAYLGGTLRMKQRSAVLGLCSEMSKGDAERQLQTILQPVNNGTHAPMQTMRFDE